jgi:hypothetical protein
MQMRNLFVIFVLSLALSSISSTLFAYPPFDPDPLPYIPPPAPYEPEPPEEIYIPVPEVPPEIMEPTPPELLEGVEPVPVTDVPDTMEDLMVCPICGSMYPLTDWDQDGDGIPDSCPCCSVVFPLGLPAVP